VLYFEIESTDRSATAYVSGGLSMAGFWQVMHECESLPPRVRSLRMDLRGVRLVQTQVPGALKESLQGWRERRQGYTRLDLPAAGLSCRIVSVEPDTDRLAARHRDNSVAIPYTNRDLIRSSSR